MNENDSPEYAAFVVRQRGAKASVKALGDRIGYGNMMVLARDIWAELNAREFPGSEFSVGPCVSLTVSCGCAGGCDWCAGSGWLTKKVKTAKNLSATIGNAIRYDQGERW